MKKNTLDQSNNIDEFLETASAFALKHDVTVADVVSAHQVMQIPRLLARLDTIAKTIAGDGMAAWDG